MEEVSLDVEVSVAENTKPSESIADMPTDIVPSCSKSDTQSEASHDKDAHDSVLVENTEHENNNLSDNDTEGLNVQTSDTKLKSYSHLIQITASNEEIMRRIQALIDQKQREVDTNNLQEFCNIHPALDAAEQDHGCARTCAVFVPRAGGKSHIKVSRVVNMCGPQQMHSNSGRSPVAGNSCTVKTEPGSDHGIEERLQNMESHLKIKSVDKKDFYNRLKNLEERILFLETLSPEYFSTAPFPKRPKMEPFQNTQSTNHMDKSMTLTEIDNKIQRLRRFLINQASGD